ncbi:MAG: hypothetical protein JRN23_01640, partial [Nitrososphaerota archaeon]|nr:hypothetical protein [Nitrososphaerota archaeon]
ILILGSPTEEAKGVMSVPTREQADDFLVPLRGRLAVILLHQAAMKTEMGRFLMGCASALGLDAVVLDTDAFYLSNITTLARALPNPNGAVLLMTESFEVRSLLPLLSSSRRLTVVDDLNSLYSLASDRRKSQQLGILMRLLSYNARVNNSWVVATAYRTEQQKRAWIEQRSLTDLGDLLLDADLEAGRLRFNLIFDRRRAGPTSSL